MTNSPFEQRFNAAMHDLYSRIVRESGYNPTVFWTMIERYGGLETAHRLLRPGADFFSYGFEKLCQMHRHGLTMEALIVSLDYKEHLFTIDELATAEERLKAAREFYEPSD
jgi:hypothetical protein